MSLHCYYLIEPRTVPTPITFTAPTFHTLSPHITACATAYSPFSSIPLRFISLYVVAKYINSNTAFGLSPNVSIQQKRGYSHASMCILSLLYNICFADAVFDFMCLARYHSNSIVPGGLLVRSYITRFTPFTSFMILVITFCSTSNGISEQSAVMKSLVLTARSAIA